MLGIALAAITLGALTAAQLVAIEAVPMARRWRRAVWCTGALGTVLLVVLIIARFLTIA